jgi:hypothetical protein
MTDKPPSDSAEHARDFARRWVDWLEGYCATRMEALGVAAEKIGAFDPYRRKPWHAFDAEGHLGGSITTGIVVDSGVLNPDLLEGKRGGKAWAEARLRDRIDAVIAHEYEEERHSTHEEAVQAAPKTDLPITDGARRILKATSQ